MKMKFSKKRNALISVLLVFLLTLSGCEMPVSFEDGGMPTATYDGGELEIEYIDVGQGDSSLLISPSGKTMLIDTGKADAYEKVKKALDDRDIKKIDTFIVTHPHADHIGSAWKIIDNYEVGELYLNGTATSKVYQKTKDSAKKANLEMKELTIDSKLDWDPHVTFKIFSPVKVGVLSGLNNESPIMQVNYNNHRFLFTGDAESEAEDTALAYDTKGLKSDVVKVGHHGSPTSSIPAFVLATKPAVAIISVGKNNSYGHPDKTVVTRWQKAGAEVYSTEKNGNIIIKTKKDELELMADRSMEPLAS